MTQECEYGKKRYWAMKAYRGSRSMAPFILDIDTRWMWVVNFTPGPL